MKSQKVKFEDKVKFWWYFENFELKQKFKDHNYDLYKKNWGIYQLEKGTLHGREIHAGILYINLFYQMHHEV